MPLHLFSFIVVAAAHCDADSLVLVVGGRGGWVGEGTSQSASAHHFEALSRLGLVVGRH
jgi:hypothetical protein